jgi:hypothetical protein
MSYLQAKSDLDFMLRFKADVINFWGFEQGARKNIKKNFDSKREYQEALAVEASKISGYQEQRNAVSQGILRATRIAKRFGVPLILTSYPAPIVGGPVINQSLFSAILKDFTHGGFADKQSIVDALNQTIGECKSVASREKRHLVNPLYWIKEMLVFVIRIPFWLIEVSGFDVSKFEDHFFGKLSKLLFFILLFIILLSIGLDKQDIKDLLLKWGI